MSKKANQTDSQEVLEPVSVLQNAEFKQEIQIPRLNHGEVFLIPIKNGIENVNQGFVTDENTYIKYYNNDSDYRVIKKN